MEDPMVSTTTLRLKYLCVRYGRLLLLGLLTVSVLSFGLAATTFAAPPEVRTETVQTDVQTVTTSLETTARVTGETPLYAPNETLTDSPVYLRSATPTLTLVAVTAVSPAVEATVRQEIVVELTASRGEEAFWQERAVLASTNATAADGNFRTATTFDIDAFARTRLAAVKDAIGSAGTLSLRVYATTAYDTGTYAGQLEASTPLVVLPDAYELTTPATAQREHATPVTNRVTVTPPTRTMAIAGYSASVPRRALPWLAAGGAAVMLAGAVWLLRSRADDLDTFLKQHATDRYAEWISRGSLPDDDRFVRIDLDALVDLVDVAIDSGKRVVYDATSETFAVIDGTAIYEYTDADPFDAESTVEPDSQPGSSPESVTHE